MIKPRVKTSLSKDAKEKSENAKKTKNANITDKKYTKNFFILILF